MTIHCSKCREAFSSLLIPQQKALEDLGNKLAYHSADKHKKEILQLNQDGTKLGAIAMWLMIMRRFAAIPESETFITEEMDKNANVLLGILGFDLKEEPTKVS